MSSNSVKTVKIINLEVYEYSLIGDPSVYVSHLFSIRYWFNQELFTITRSYAAFCELDARLKRKYPRTEFPVLKLAGLPLFTYRTPRQGLLSNPGALSPAADIRATMTTSDVSGGAKDAAAVITDKKSLSKLLVRRTDNASEVISQKLNMLTVYIQLLLKIPEIIMSSEILDFFDLNTVDGNFVEEVADAGLSCVDIMLSDQPRVNKTVGTRFILPVSGLDETDLVLWSFSSRRKDIGFSVEFNGGVVVPYQRVESHKETVQGSFEVPVGTVDGDVNLIWDNTYSRLVSKFITYSVKVVKKYDFSQAVDLSREAQQKRAENAQQREYLKTVLNSLAKAVLGTAGADSFNSRSVHNSSMVSSNSAEDMAGASSRSGSGSSTGNNTNAPSSAAVPTTNSNDKKDEEIVRLRDEKKSLQIALMTSESALAEERAMWAKSSDRLDIVLTSKETLEEEIQQLSDELEQAKAQLEVKTRQEEVHVQQNKEFHELLQQFNALRQSHEEVRAELALLKETTLGSLEASLAKQKGEKKQLKAYALQLKADMERITLEKETAAHERELAQIAGGEWRARVETLELEVEELRSRPATTAATPATQYDGDANYATTARPDPLSAAVDDSQARSPHLATADVSETHMSPRIMIIGNEDEADESEEEDPEAFALTSPNRTYDSSQQQYSQQVDEDEDEDEPFYTNEQFEEDVENIADTLVKEFKEIKEKTMSIFPSWDNILGEEEDFGDGSGGGAGSSRSADQTNIFGF